MPVTTLLSFTSSSPPDTTISQLSLALTTFEKDVRFVIGTKLQSPTTIQITSEWPLVQHPSDLATSPSHQAFVKIVESFAESSLATMSALLEKSVFADGNPPLVEFVCSSFPVASFTPELQTKVEDDFARFEAIYRRRGAPEVVGEGGLAIGWAEEKDGVRGFLVVRGWTEMTSFEEATQTEEFKEAIPTLMGWGVPFELWHVERRWESRGL